MNQVSAFRVGYLGPTVGITQEEVNAYGQLTGDNQGVHTDPVMARNGLFGVTVVQGAFLVGILPRLLPGLGPQVFPEHDTLNRGYEMVKFISFVPVGSMIYAEVVGVRSRTLLGTSRHECDFKIFVAGLDKPAVTGTMILIQTPKKSREAP